MKVFLILFCLFWLTIPASTAQMPEAVSLVRLLATPEKFHGKLVRVEGYLHNQFEDSALYFSKDHGDYLMGESALWITYGKNPSLQAASAKTKPENLRYFDSKYVLVEGVFDKNASGHLGAFAGGLSNATRVMEKIRFFDGEKKLYR
jgi:hypothetical protein